MKITSTDTTMTSSSGHHAAAIDTQQPYGRWRVSWLPGRTVTYNQAITALVLAGHISEGATGPRHRLWPHVQGWAAELDLTATQAVAAVRGSSI